MASFYASYPALGGGSAGITSINGDTTSAQLIVGGTGISVATVSGTTTITNTQPFTTGNLTDAGTDGITIGNGTGAVNGSGTTISQHVADTTHNGYLSSTDWNTFNNKQPTITTGNLTDAGTDGIVVGNGSGAVIGTGTTISQSAAASGQNGYLKSSDWVTFNAKQAAGNYITALTGDVTASGPGSVAATLATVNTNIGTFNNAIITVNAKGLITSAASGASGTGTVTSVTFTGDGTVLSSTPSSAVTTSGTLTASLATAASGKFLAGPTSGAAATPTYRSIASSDIPTVAFSITGIPTGSINGSDNIVVYPSSGLIIDTNSGYNATTGKYTIQVAGTYAVYGLTSFTFTQALGISFNFSIQKNSTDIITNYQIFSNASVNSGTPSVYAVLSFAVNDTVQMVINSNGSSPAYANVAAKHGFSLSRIGN